MKQSLLDFAAERLQNETAQVFHDSALAAARSTLMEDLERQGVDVANAHPILLDAYLSEWRLPALYEMLVQRTVPGEFGGGLRKAGRPSEFIRSALIAAAYQDELRRSWASTGRQPTKATVCERARKRLGIRRDAVRKGSRRFFLTMAVASRGRQEPEAVKGMLVSLAAFSESLARSEDELRQTPRLVGQKSA